jgi:AbrB family looped-hinge helix DNA binding protein
LAAVGGRNLKRRRILIICTPVSLATGAFWYDNPTVTTVLSQKGQIVLPASIRNQLHLSPGDDFEISVEDEETITLRRISRPANQGLVDLLLKCPSPLPLPKREKDDTAALEL